MGGAEADINNLPQFIEDRLVPQFQQSIGRSVVTSAVGKQREEQHLSQSRFNEAGGFLRRPQDANVLVPTDSVVDMRNRADPLDEVALPMPGRRIQPPRITAESGPRSAVAQDVAQIAPGFSEK